MKNFTVNLIFILFLSQYTIGQIVISKPNLGFTQACAKSTFNDYSVTFTFSPESGLSTSNQFIVELSDETGDFSSPTVVHTSVAGSVIVSPATLNFSIPTTTAGEAYRIRIKSTAPVASSTPSDAFAAYYKAQDSPFSINNLIETAVFCSGGSYLLTIDNPGGPLNDSPLNYPSLTFNWFKETSETTSVFVASGESLLVSEEGTYFIETNYGSCTSDSFSNRVIVSEASSGSVLTSINSSLGNPYCSANGPTTLSTLNGISYQWYKDGVEISGATDQMYVTNEAGNYTVNIDLGECTTTASIDLVNTDFESSINVSEVYTLQEDETLFVELTTTAINPEYEWYLNDTLISGETSSTLEVTQQGNYKAIVNQTSGCISSQEFVFNVIVALPDIPNMISPNGDNINDTWVIPQSFNTGGNTQVTILSSQGKIVLNTTDYQNNWPQEPLDYKDVNPVFYYIINNQGKSYKGSITVIK